MLSFPSTHTILPLAFMIPCQWIFLVTAFTPLLSSALDGGVWQDLVVHSSIRSQEFTGYCCVCLYTKLGKYDVYQEDRRSPPLSWSLHWTPGHQPNHHAHFSCATSFTPSISPCAVVSFPCRTSHWLTEFNNSQQILLEKKETRGRTAPQWVSLQ